MKKLIITLLGALTLMGGHVAFAAEQNITVPKCSIGVYPYNKSASPSYGTAGDAFIKILSGFKLNASSLSDVYNTVSASECLSRVPYGQSHVQGVPVLKGFYKNVLTAANLLQQVPRAKHEHTYINTSLQDTNFYKSFIYSFEIDLESDGVNNTKSNELQCITPVPSTFSGNAADLLDCDGYVASLYGGTKITKTNSGGKTLIVWKFGVDSAGNYIYKPSDQAVGINALPYTMGDNPGMQAGLHTIDPSADLTNPLSPYRVFRPDVVMTSKDDRTDEYWSATTTAKALIRNYEINAPSIVRDGTTYSPTTPSFNAFFYLTCKGLDQANTGWCPSKVNGGEGLSVNVKNTSDGTTSPRTRLFWVNIGSVASIWQQPVTPPPADLACADLQWDGPFYKPGNLGIYAPDLVHPNSLLQNEAAVMKFKTIYESGPASAKKRPLEYRWVAFNGETNRPSWFTNEDSGTYQLILPLLPLITTSLPGNLVQVAHAALQPVGGNLSIENNNGAIGIGTSAGANLELINIGGFKDEKNSPGAAINPLTDDDFQVWYSGGSEGVKLGVQAFYTDGAKEKAKPCHLEITIQPPPVTCIGLTISPSTLAANTPVTFTVTPKFSPSGKTIPLNYAWDAKSSGNIISLLPNLGTLQSIDPSLIQIIPGTSNTDGSASWVQTGVINTIQTGSALSKITDPCAKGGCETTTKPTFNPGGPIEITTPSAPVINQLNLNTVGNFGGADVLSGLQLGNSNTAIQNVGLQLQPSIGDVTQSPFLTDGFGGFKDSVSSSAAAVNPYTETVDNKTYYTGGPGNTKISVQGVGKDGTIYPACKADLVTSPPVICKMLSVKFFDGATEVPKASMVAGKTYRIEIDKANSKKSDGTPITKFDIRLTNIDGPGAYGTLAPNPGNAASCSGITGAAGTSGTDSTSVDCKYLYTPKGGDTIKIEADPTDGVALCTVSQTIPTPPLAICKQIAVIFMDGVTTIAKEAMVAGKTYNISIDKAGTIKTDGSPVLKYSIKVSNPDGPGAYGTVTADPSNAATCEPVSSAAGTTGVAGTSVDCKYNYVPKANDSITVEAYPTDGVALCSINQIIPAAPGTPICKSLNLITNPLLGGNEIAQNQKVDFTTDPRDTDNNDRNPVVYTETGTGGFIASPLNAASCTLVPASSSATITFEAPNTCKYSYQAANDGTASSVNVKVKQNDGVADCSKDFVVKPTTTNPTCLALNLQVNGAYTLNPLLTPGNSYSLQASPVKTDGTPELYLQWTETGNGQLVGQPTNPAICPATIDNATVQTPSFCRYIYAGATTTTDGFSVQAVPTDGNPNCQAASQSYKPPVETPFCLYLDLSHNNPDTFDGASSDLTAVVVMSDGSHYNDHVRFVSTDGSGQFNGSLAVGGAGTSNYRSSVNGTNSTQTVHFGGGSGSTGLNIFLADTSVPQSAACQRQLAPTPTNKVCDHAPEIKQQGGTLQYCAENGDSAQYVWHIEGAGNPVFTNNTNTSIGQCVVLDQNYSDFHLTVQDTNPAYQYICHDDYTKEGTPKITKSIAEAASSSYSTKINYSTKTSSYTEEIKYKLAFTPSNYQDGSYMVANIYDPAFTGTIHGHKPNSKTGTQDGGNVAIHLNTIQVTDLNGTNYPSCGSTPTPADKCFTVSTSSSHDGFGYVTIHGIQSTNTINITYGGTLTSSITITECQEGVACNEQFINQSFVTDMQFCTEDSSGGGSGTPTYTCTPPENLSSPQCQEITYYDVSGLPHKFNPCDHMTITSNVTTAEGVCQYFLTRASGDVFLEDQLKYGLDVSKCYPFKNVSSTVVTPIPPSPEHLIKTGQESATSQIININHEVCSAGQNNFDNLKKSDGTKLNSSEIESLSKLFGANLTTLSSQICEVGLVPGLDWDADIIKAALEQNVGKLTRWETENAIANPITSTSDFTGGIYYYNGTGAGDKVAINSLTIPEGQGPFTIIINNADLEVNGDITYGTGSATTDPKSISSLGVIVLGGNMYIGNNVKTLSGAYFVERSTDPLTGNIFAGSKSNHTDNTENQLTVYGSIYGNIGPLFLHRTGSGDLAQDQGAVTIRYDQRIIQNPPQGLSDLLGNFSQSEFAQ